MTAPREGAFFISPHTLKRETLLGEDMKLLTLFDRCLSAPYIHAGEGADYYTERVGSTLYIYLESSNGEEDWKNNLDFPTRAYCRGKECPFRAHRGFLRVWEALIPALAPLIADESVRKLVTVGFSHGAALAVLCHEYVWVHRPDLRTMQEGYGFGCPRVLWGRYPTERWERFTVIRNIDDLVTHLPPAILGFRHVGKMIEIGARGRYSRIDAHRPENIAAELRRYERGKKAP